MRLMDIHNTGRSCITIKCNGLFVLTFLKDCFDLPGLINALYGSLTQRKLEIPALSNVHKTSHFSYFFLQWFC